MLGNDNVDVYFIQKEPSRLTYRMAPFSKNSKKYISIFYTKSNTPLQSNGA
jgi:hypothetical protein